MKLDIPLIKSITELADYFLALPGKLVDAGMKPFSDYYSLKERISRGKELVELREMGKILQRLYISKGSIIPFFKEIEAQRRNSDFGIQDVEWFVDEVIESLEQLRELSESASFGSFSLAAEGAIKIGEAQNYFGRLKGIAAREIISTGKLSEIAAELERLQSGAEPLLKAIDEYRRSLDHTR